MLMGAAQRGAPVEITTTAGGRKMTYRGRLMETSIHPGMDTLELTVSTDGECFSQPEYTKPATNGVAINEEQNDMVSHVDYDRRRRLVHVSIETSEGSNVFLDRDHNEIDRNLGEEMPLYASFPEEIWTAIKNSQARVV